MSLAPPLPTQLPLCLSAGSMRCALWDSDSQENVGDPQPLGYGSHQDSAPIFTKESWYQEGVGGFGVTAR